MPLKDKEKRKEYQKEYHEKWYKNNRERTRKQQIGRRKQIKEWYTAYKATLVCEKCGENHVACLDFHHKADKEDNISRLVLSSIDKLKREIAKCTVLCANCHRKLHYEQKNEEK